MGRVSRRCALSTRAVSWLVGGLAVAMAWLTWMPAMQVVHFGAAVLLLWILPAVGWFLVLPGGFLLRLVSGLGLAFVGSGLVTLMLYLFPGPFPGVIARFVYVAIAVASLLVGRRLRRPKGNRERKRPTRYYLALLLVLAVAILTRFLNIGYSEFQGDEAVVMRRVAEALNGNDTTLFLHQKGPVEILVPMSLWTLTGTITEWQARFPFALAGVLAVLTVACLSEMWFGWRAGMVSGFLAAINGFLVAFGRIVQYQNLVVAMGGLSLLWLLYHRRHRGAGQLVLAAVFLAFGLLAHYDAVLVGPAALTILVAGMAKSDRRERKRYIYALLLALISGVVILGLFYVPFVSNSMFARTFNYLRGGRLGNGVFHNSLWTSWRMSTFYNSLYYVLGLLVLVVAAAMLRLGTGDAWLYFLIPFVFYSFVVADPRTHIYTWYPGAVVLTGGALLRLHGHVLRRWGTILLWFAGVWLVLCTGYVYVAFINHQVEYKRAWPESRHPLYPVPFADDQLPPYGFFGFPYQAGWKAVEALFAQGVLDGTYASNEEPEITTWYVRSGVRTMCEGPDVYVVAERVQDEVAIDWDELDRYALRAQILVQGRPKIRVYERRGRNDAVLTLDAEEYVRQYDAQTTVAAQLPSEYHGAHSTEYDFGNVARLLGYDLTRSAVQRGDEFRVTLYWQALTSPDRNYQVFVHLALGDQLVAQHDGAPACAHAPTSLWELGERIRDEHVIPVGNTVPTGTVALYVGMYDLLTLERLPVDGDADGRVLLTTIEVAP